MHITAPSAVSVRTEYFSRFGPRPPRSLRQPRTDSSRTAKRAIVKHQPAFHRTYPSDRKLANAAALVTVSGKETWFRLGRTIAPDWGTAWQVTGEVTPGFFLPN